MYIPEGNIHDISFFLVTSQGIKGRDKDAGKTVKKIQ
jgi:hypothetical protein